MDVLNTYGGGTDVGLAIIASICAALAIVSFIVAFAIEEEVIGVFALLFVMIAVIAFCNISSPVRHEVTLRPDGVIDAVKYNIIEQRGAIFVIEEREVSAE